MYIYLNYLSWYENTLFFNYLTPTRQIVYQVNQVALYFLFP